MSWDAYRGNIRMETIAAALQTAIVAGATTGDQPQLHLAEIWLAGDPTAADTDTGRVRARHILYSPEDDPGDAQAGSTGAAGGIPPDRPVVDRRPGRGRAGHAGAARPSPTSRRARPRSPRWPRPTVTTPAAAPRAATWATSLRGAMVPEFDDALFDHLDTLKPGDVIGPVKTDFG